MFGGPPSLSGADDRGHSTKKLNSGISLDGEFGNEVKSLLTFESCPELLRGSGLRAILRKGGQIFVNSAGSAKTYGLSEPVERLDVFFSHNWSCLRKHKVLCLMLHFNIWPAFLATSCFVGLLALVSLLGWNPTFRIYEGTQTTGIIGYLTPIPFFWISWFGIRELTSCGNNPRIFLDKTCIHQEDAEIQKLGIQKLGAFLSSADSVVVCFSPVYLRKLWTIYEAATFLCLKEVKDLHVIPYQLPWVVLAITLVMMTFNASSIILRIGTTQTSLELWLAPLFALLYAVTCRQMAAAKAEISSTLANFTVDSSNCFDERDRPIVYRNIAVLMHARFKLPPDMPQKEALAYFEELVRTLLPTAFAKSLGRGNIHYKYVAMISILTCFPRVLDHLSCVVNDGYGWRYYIHAWLCMHVCLSLWISPAGLVLVDRLASVNLHWTGRLDALWVAISALAGWVLIALCYAPALWFFEALVDYRPGDAWDEDADHAFLAFILYTLVGSTGAVLLLSGTGRRLFRRCARRPGPEEHNTEEALENLRLKIAQDIASRPLAKLQDDMPIIEEVWDDKAILHDGGINVRL